MASATPTCLCGLATSPRLMCARHSQAKLWDLSTGEPKLLAAKDLKAGAIFAAAFCPESPFLLAAGGAKGKMVVWDTLQQPGIAAKYGQQRPRRKAAAAAAIDSDDAEED